jgi:hypothetical protein
VFNVVFVGYSLAKNNLNNTYQYNMISKKFSKTMNYLIILIKFKVSGFSCRSVYFLKLHHFFLSDLPTILEYSEKGKYCFNILERFIVECFVY